MIYIGKNPNIPKAIEYYTKAWDSSCSISNSELEERSILSLACAHYHHGNLEDIEKDYQRILDQAIELEHYDNLVPMLSLAGRINLSEINSDVSSAAKVFAQAIFAGIMLTYQKLEYESFFDNKDMIMHSFEVLREICEAIYDQIEISGVERMQQFYEQLLLMLQNSELETKWMQKYLKPIEKYLEKLPDKHLWVFVVESWNSEDP